VVGGGWGVVGGGRWMVDGGGGAEAVAAAFRTRPILRKERRQTA
jgi:hypothetical protein